MAAIYNSEGSVLKNEKKYENAKLRYKKAIQVIISHYGTDNHVDAGKSYNNLGEVLRIQGRYQDAIECYEKAIRIKSAWYKTEDHVDVAMSHNNLGFLFMSQAQYTKSLTHLNKALSIFTKNLPSNHINITRVQDTIQQCQVLLILNPSNDSSNQIG